MHRPRPIPIPGDYPFAEFSKQPVGSGVYVPGIVTDVHFSSGGGKLLDCSEDTGLKNANVIPIPPPAQPLTTCVPAPSLEREFVFNIYLPPNPQVTLARAGITVPPVPLYVADYPMPSLPGPTPAIERVDTANGVTFLRVRVDLRNWASIRYFRRIVAGWVLPASDNWGLDRWRLVLHRLHVTDNAENKEIRGPTDWRLWVNTNNAVVPAQPPLPRQEWVRVLRGAVEVGTEDFGGAPWSTSAEAADRSLGPDLLRYPPAPDSPLPLPRDEGILLHLTGYDSDGILDDDVGTVLEFLPARPGVYQKANWCTEVAEGGGLLLSQCARYRADFEVVPGPPLPDAVVFANARAVAAQYVITCPRGTGSPGNVGTCEGIWRPSPANPLDIVLEPGSGPVDPRTLEPFRPGTPERAITEMSLADFAAAVTATLQTDPARVDRLMTSLREMIDGMLVDPPLGGDAQAELDVLRIVVPTEVFARHFGDIPRPRPDPTWPRARLTGAGRVWAVSGPLRIRGLALYCAPAGWPNSMTVRWGPHRFDLDLLFESRCEPPPGVASSSLQSGVHRGIGVGRLDGRAGAVAEWTLSDMGEPGRDRDTLAIKVRDGSTGEVVLEASGVLSRGNLKMHRR